MYQGTTRMALKFLWQAPRTADGYAVWPLAAQWPIPCQPNRLGV